MPFWTRQVHNRGMRVAFIAISVRCNVFYRVICLCRSFHHVLWYAAYGWPKAVCTRQTSPTTSYKPVPCSSWFICCSFFLWKRKQNTNQIKIVTLSKFSKKTKKKLPNRSYEPVMSSVTRIRIGKKAKVEEISQTDRHGEESKNKTNKFYINIMWLLI